MTLAEDLRAGTRRLHRIAERAGVVGAVLRGRASRGEYALLMRNLLPAYVALERALVAHRGAPGLAALTRPEVFRASALEADLAALAGRDFAATVPLLPEGEAYARRIVEASDREPTLLAAHAYTRYLGDLSGGQVLADVLSRRLGLGPEALGFYRFPEITRIDAFKAAFRTALDGLGEQTGTGAAVVAEARAAFRHNIAVSRAARRTHDPRG